MIRLCAAAVGGFVAAIVLGAILVLAEPEPAVHTQAARPERLQLHGEVVLDAPAGDGWWAVKVQAVCDTGTGYLIYVIRPESNAQEPRVKLVANGCQKAQAER